MQLWKRARRNGNKLTIKWGEQNWAQKAGVAGIDHDGEDVRWLGRDNSIYT